MPNVKLPTAESAQRALGTVDRVSTQLKPYLDARSVLARHHYIEMGTLRHFEVHYAEPAVLREAVVQPTDADGLIVVALCDSPNECQAAVENATAVEIASHPEVIIGVPPPLQRISAEVQDARCWQSVADNTPELAQDSYAAAEVARQVAASRRALLRRLAALFGLYGENTSAMRRWHGGRRFDLPARGGLSAKLSTMYDSRERRVSPPPLGIESRQRRRLATGFPQEGLSVDYAWGCVPPMLSADILSATVWR
jgi:hypothetical protein